MDYILTMLNKKKVLIYFRFITCAIFLFALSIVLLGQSHEIRFGNLSNEFNFPNNRIFGIYKDSKGYLWILNAENVVMFNGYRFETFSPENDSSDHYIYGDRFISIFEEDNGQIWIGSNLGLNKYIEKNNTFRPIVLNEPGRNRINTILPYNDSLLLVSTPRKNILINKLTERSSQLKKINTITSTFTDSYGNYWFGTNNGEVYKNFQKTAIKIDESINSMFFHNKKHFYLGTSNGLYIASFADSTKKYKPEKIAHFTRTIEFQSLSHNEVSSLAYFEGNLWVGTRNGLNRIEINDDGFPSSVEKFFHHPYVPFSLANNQISSLYVDNENTLWISTLSGLNTLDESKTWFFSIANEPNDETSLPDNHIVSLINDPYNNLWICGYHMGVMRYRPIDKSFKVYTVTNTSENADRVRNLFRINQDLFFSTQNDIFIYDIKIDDFLKLNLLKDKNKAIKGKNPEFFGADSNGNLWLMNRRFIFRGTLDRDSNNFLIQDEYKNKESENLTCGFITHDNYKWFGQGNTLISFSPENKIRRIQLPDYNTTVLPTIQCISNDLEGNLWVGTDNGLFFLPNYKLQVNNDSILRYGTEDGLADENINSLICDVYGSIWLSTWKGIVTFNSNLLGGRFTSFNSNEGILDEKFNLRSFSYDTTNNTLYFGSINGINYTHIEEIKNAVSSVSPIIEGLEIRNDFIKMGEQNKYFNISNINPDTVLITLNRFIFNTNIFIRSSEYKSVEKQIAVFKTDKDNNEWQYAHDGIIPISGMKKRTHKISLIIYDYAGRRGPVKTVILNRKKLSTPLYIGGALILVITLAIIRNQQIKNKKKRKKYKYSKLSNKDSEAISVQLKSLMTKEKLYLNPQLSPDEIAKKLNIKPMTLSQVLNEYMKIGFYDFVNTLRINEFKERIGKKEYNHFSLTGIALECGFTSKSSFYRSFKKITGQTPAAFEKTITNNTESNK